MKTINYFLITTLLFSIIDISIVYGQSKVIRQETDKAGNLTFAEFETDSVHTMKESKLLLKQMLDLGKDEEFVLTNSKTDELGFIHHYYDQHYKGIRVAYSSYSVHGNKEESVNTMNGTYNKIGDIVTVAQLKEKDALAYAMQYVDAETYKWEIPEEEQWLKEYYNQSYYPKGELVIVKDRLKTNEAFRLAWKFDVYAHIPLSRNLIYVDAVTGDILDTESKIYHLNSQGTAATRYSGTRNITTDSFTGGFRLRETRNNVRIETYNMRNRGTIYAEAPDFRDNDNNWTASEFNNANSDNAALDAHWAAEKVYDYFKTVHNRNSWDGTGGPILNYIHTDLLAFGYNNNVNAFWDDQRITYGDGNVCHDPLTSLDIVAHEIAHGINSSTSKMKYEGESGALNESLSDIWAACVEYWAAPEKQIWLAAEDVTRCAIALRSMSNPNLRFQPDTYGLNITPGILHWYNTVGCIPTWENDYCGIHTNSGVPNFWFFLLVSGGFGTNDIGNFYFVDGIGIENAAKIVYRAETVILASANEQTVTFNQFRNATITAATNLFGSNSPEVVSVMNAWHAVGVGNRYGYAISGSHYLYPSDTYRIKNLPDGISIAWSSVNGNLAFTSAAADSVVVTAKAYNVTDTIIAAIRHNGTTILTLRYSVYSYDFFIWADDYSVSCKPHRFDAPLIAGASVTWDYHPAIAVTEQSDNYIRITVSDTLPGKLWLSATVTDANGTIVAADTNSLPNHNLKGMELVPFISWYEPVNGANRKRYGFRVDIRPADISRNDLCFTWINEDSNNGSIYSFFLGSATIETGGYSGIGPLCVSVIPKPGDLIDPGGPILLMGTLPPPPPAYPFIPLDLPDYARVTLPADYTGTITCRVEDVCGRSYSGTKTITNTSSSTYNVNAVPSLGIVSVRKSQDSMESKSESVEVRLYYSGVPVLSQQAKSSDAEIVLNTSGLSTGVYQVVILKGGQKIQSQSIIIVAL
jgi:Zn-dependent metalloprotease